MINIGVLSLSVFQSWIECIYGIPKQEQILGYLSESTFQPVYPIYIYRARPIQIKAVSLYVHMTDDSELLTKYQQNNIRTLVPIFISSFKIQHHWECRYKSYGHSLDDFIQDTLKIPITIYCYYAP